MSYDVDVWTQTLDLILPGFSFLAECSSDWLCHPVTGARYTVNRLYPELGLAVQFGYPNSQAPTAGPGQEEVLRDICHRAGISLVEFDSGIAGGDRALQQLVAALKKASRRVAQQRGARDTKRHLLPRIARARKTCESILETTSRARQAHQAAAARARHRANAASVAGTRTATLPALLAFLRSVLKRVVLLVGVLLAVNAAAFLIARSLSLRGPFHFNYVPDTTVELAEVFSPYPEYLGGLLQGDLGSVRVGYSSGTSPVLGFIAERLPRSLVLLGSAVVFAMVVGLAIGFLSVNRRTYRTNPLALIISLAGFSMPGFYLGIVVLYLIIWIAMRFGRGVFFLPTMGYGIDEHLILPLLALAVRPTAEVARLTAEMLGEELPKDYVKVARGKGLSERAVLLRHAFRNVVAVVVQALSNSWSYLLGSLVIIERVFAWRGMGDALIDSVTWGRGVTPTFHPALVAALATSLALLYLLADQATGLLAWCLDPRLRRPPGGAS